MVELLESYELTDEQYQKFLDEVEKVPSNRSPMEGKDVRLAFEFMEDTGLRITELLHVCKEDLDFQTRILTVTHPKTEQTCKCSVWKYKDLYTRKRVLDKSDKNCKRCHGTGKWKKPQRTTFTPRIHDRMFEYVKQFPEGEPIFPTTRQSFWVWGKKAGNNADINIFRQLEERKIVGIYNHLFRKLCSKRTTRDAKLDDYKDQLVACKLRHSYQKVTDRYTEIDINYLIQWERKQYTFK